MSLKFGVLLADDAMIRINLIGFALNVAFIVFYYLYVPNNEKTKIWGQIGIAGAFAAGAIAYSQYEDPNVIEFRFGLIITIFLFSLVASPFLSLVSSRRVFDIKEGESIFFFLLFYQGDIIKNKSTEGLPFPLILSGTIVSFSWLLYGLCLNNTTIVLQNFVLFGMSAVQLSLFVIYPSSGKSKQVKSKKSKKSN